MDAVVTKYSGVCSNLCPVQHRYVFVLFCQVQNHVVDINLLRPKLCCCQNNERCWRKRIKDLAQHPFVICKVSIKVGSEKHDGRVPSFFKPAAKHLQTKIDEAPRLCLNRNLPAQRRERVAHLVAVTAGRRGHDRVANHQHPVSANLWPHHWADQLGKLNLHALW